MSTELPMHKATTQTNIAWRRGTHFLYRHFVAPQSATEDDRRREFILNIILLGSLVLLILLDGFILVSWLFKGTAYQGVSFVEFSGIVAVFLGLLILSRKGFYRFSAKILVFIYFLLTTYSMYRWSVWLPNVLLGYVITILVASILLGTRSSFLVAGVIAAAAITINALQIMHLIPVELYWRYDPPQFKDPIIYSLVFFLVVLLSWLSNREIERSLSRARRSERDLKEERDLLEIKVDERTQELKLAQAEKIAQLYRFAEFGKISSGIFHDLMNSLNAVIANVSELESSSEDTTEVKGYLLKSVAASKRMGSLLAAARKQVQISAADELFSLNKELHDAVDILRYHAEEFILAIEVRDPEELLTYGNPIKFHQAALNLISNAIDACEGQRKERAIIHISLSLANGQAVLEVLDRGCGIPAKIIGKIFDPFFTTKTSTQGIGLGLSATKEIIEKDFHGTIDVESEGGAGSLFRVSFPVMRSKAA